MHLSTLAHVGTQVRVMSNYSGVNTSAPISSLLSGFGGGDDAPTPAAPIKKAAKKN